MSVAGKPIPGWFAVLVMLIVGSLCSATASARTLNAQVCHAVQRAGEGVGATMARPARWRCDGGGWSIAGEAMLVRFRTRPGQPPARSLVTFASRFAGLELAVVDARGTIRTARFGPDEANHLPAGPMMVFALPATPEAPREVLVRIVRPWTKAIGSDAVLDSNPAGTGWPIGQVVAMAMICGLLIVPLLLTGAVYAVLPERFVLWHLCVTAAMLVQVLIGTGYIHLALAIPEGLEGPVNSLCYAAMGSAAMLFAADFIEPGRMSALLRRALQLAAPVILAVGMVAALPLELVRPWAITAAHLVMLPPLVLVLAANIDAARRGSAAAWYQIVGWTPAMLVGGAKVVAYALPGNAPMDGTVTYYLGLAMEVVAATMGMVSRFVALRRERDRATALAHVLEDVAERDALTGLWNRRAVERNFGDLFAQGFRTMAVLDLDLFKDVNDRFGHATGDAVLRAVGAALLDDADTFAARLGGEEFLLMLRGPGSAERAERCRRAITARVTATVPGLDRVVTASMGLVEHDPAGALRVEFAMLYRHCDRLLYEAKRLGRNRMMRERLTSFAPNLRTSAVS